jgi:Chalcone isomerase-like
MRAFPMALVLLTVTATAIAVAGERGGVTMPDTQTVEGKNLVLNGMGIREATVFNVKVYVAGLYVEKKSQAPEELIRSEQVKRLDLVFVRDVDHDDVVEAWQKGFKNNGADMAKLKSRMDQLAGWMPDMKKKDTLTFVYVPGAGVTVSLRGQPKGTIAGADFATALFSIWLGNDPADKDLKKGLIGKE